MDVHVPWQCESKLCLVIVCNSIHLCVRQCLPLTTQTRLAWFSCTSDPDYHRDSSKRLKSTSSSKLGFLMAPWFLFSRLEKLQRTHASAQENEISCWSDRNSKLTKPRGTCGCFVLQLVWRPALQLFKKSHGTARCTVWKTTTSALKIETLRNSTIFVQDQQETKPSVCPFQVRARVHWSCHWQKCYPGRQWCIARCTQRGSVNPV